MIHPLEEIRSLQDENARLNADAWELLLALEHAVSIAEAETLGTWDDLLPYRKTIKRLKGRL